MHWFEAFFASGAFVAAFFRVSLVVGTLRGGAGDVCSAPPPRSRWCASGFSGREALETFFLLPLLVPQILLGAALYLFYARLAVQASIWTLLCGHLVIATPYVIRSVTAGLVGLDPRLEEAAMSLGATRIEAFFKVTLPLSAFEPAVGGDLCLHHLVFRHQSGAVFVGAGIDQPAGSPLLADPMAGRPDDRGRLHAADRGHQAA